MAAEGSTSGATGAPANKPQQQPQQPQFQPPRDSSRTLGKRDASSAFGVVAASTDPLRSFIRQREDEPGTFLRILSSTCAGLKADTDIGPEDRAQLGAALREHEQGRRESATQRLFAWLTAGRTALLEAYAQRRLEREAFTEEPALFSPARIHGVKLGPRIGTHAGAPLYRVFIGEKELQVDAFPLPCRTAAEVNAHASVPAASHARQGIHALRTLEVAAALAGRCPDAMARVLGWCHIPSAGLGDSALFVVTEKTVDSAALRRPKQIDDQLRCLRVVARGRPLAPSHGQ